MAHDFLDVATALGLLVWRTGQCACRPLGSCQYHSIYPLTAPEPKDWNNLQGGIVAGMCWADTSVSGYIIRREYDGTSANWIEVYRLDTTNHVVVTPFGTGIGSIAAATTTDLCSKPQSSINVTSAATITSFGSSCPQAGTLKLLTFSGASTLVYNGVSMILQGGNSATAAKMSAVLASAP